MYVLGISTLTIDSFTLFSGCANHKGSSNFVPGFRSSDSEERSRKPMHNRMYNAKQLEHVKEQISIFQTKQV